MSYAGGTKGLLSDATSLYVIKILQILIPLASIPYLARVLDREAFGYVIVAQTTAVFFGMIVEYGFNYSATREVSEARGDRGRVSEIFGLVTVSKLILSLVCTLAILGYTSLAMGLTLYKALPIVALTVVQAFLPLWYFQGSFNLKISSLIELLFRFLLLSLTFLWIRRPEQGADYLWLSAGCVLGSVMAQHLFILQQVELRMPPPSTLWHTLKEGFSLFVLRVGSALYSSGSLVMLSGVAGPPQVSLYAGSDKLFRSAASLLTPLGDVFFPRVVAAEPGLQRQRLTLLASGLLLAISVGMALVLSIWADTWVLWFLGPKFEDAVLLLRILVWDIPLIALGTILGIFLLLPRKLEKVFTASVVLAGLWCTFSVYVLVPIIGITWMALTILIAEIIVIAGCAAGLLWSRVRHG